MKLRANPKLLILAALGLVLAWRILVVNVSDHHMQLRTPDAATALQWDADHPKALLAEGFELAQINPDLAILRLEQAVRENVAEGRSYALLGRLWETRGNREKAEKAFEAAARIAPQRTDVQAEVAAYWMRRGDLARALEHWDVVLAVRHDLKPKLFPELLKLAEDPHSHTAFSHLLKRPVVWWPDFYAYAADHAIRLDTLRRLFEIQGSANAVSEPALRAYLARLQHEGLWGEAYFIWLNSLPAEQLTTMGNLFNGSFEYPLSNLGFDWQNDRVGHILVETAASYGTTGKRALHILFRGPRINFRHFYQHTMLAPGAYAMRGRVRPENLETTGGLQWTVTCAGTGQPLSDSERFLGSDQWRHFAFQFSVPEQGCEVQTVRLQLAGQAALDYEAKGGIWFDDLTIERLQQ